MGMELKFYPEKKIGSEVNLSHVKTEYATDDFIREWQSEKIREMEDFSTWHEKNKDNIKEKKKHISWAVVEGIIADENPRTIWEFNKKLVANSGERVIALRNNILNSESEILGNVAKRLAVYLPNWKPKGVSISFTCNEGANFCIENSGITVDLARLSIGPASFEQIEDGLVHELVHEWMKDPQAEKYASKERIMRGLVGEGIATHIAKQDLKKHHEKNGANFEDFRKKSFELFEKFLNCSEDDDLAAFKNVFLNMGEFYVVGNEIAKNVENKIGLEKFRELLLEIRKNPKVLLDKYNQLKDL
jgi:hypothetical protein